MTYTPPHLVMWINMIESAIDRTDYAAQQARRIGERLIADQLKQAADQLRTACADAKRVRGS